MSLADKPNEEIVRLAQDVVDGKVFGTWQLPNNEGDMLPMIFMPIALGCTIPENAGHAYEYLDKAGPRSINGYPCFFSVTFLNGPDSIKLSKLVKHLWEKRKHERADLTDLLNDAGEQQ